MSDFEDIAIKRVIGPQAANDPRLRSLDFIISRPADDGWIKCFRKIYGSYLTKEGPFGKDGIFIDPGLGIITQQINPPALSTPLNNSFSIEWPKSVVDDRKKEITDFMEKYVSDANDCYRRERA